MRRLLLIIAVILCGVVCFAQKDVTKFLGFPVDGPKSEMIKNLKSKGFKLCNDQGVEYMTGRFNGSDVLVFIVTDNGKVSRIVVRDENAMGETDIRIRFNRLCGQFENSDKYISLEDCKIPESEDIGYEMTVNDKRYEAVFHQLPEGYVKKSSILETFFDDLEDKDHSIFETISKKNVWFMISKSEYGKYYISMFYDNEYNRANGEDL